MGDDVVLSRSTNTTSLSQPRKQQPTQKVIQPTASIYMDTYQCQTSSNSCGLVGGILSGIFGAGIWALNSSARLINAANSGGMGLGDLWLMSKISNNDDCNSYCNNSRPIVINSYPRPALCRGFSRLPSRFTCRPRPHNFSTFNLTPSGRFQPVKLKSCKFDKFC